MFIVSLDRNIRELASQALHNLTPADPEYMAKTGMLSIIRPLNNLYSGRICFGERMKAAKKPPVMENKPRWSPGRAEWLI